MLVRLAADTALPYNRNMYTISETPTFQAQGAKIWNDTERMAFISYIAENPEAGDIIQGADGARKVRWAAQGKGKRGGARVIYFNLLDDGVIVLIGVYVKSEQTNILPKAVKGLKNEIK